MKQLVCRQENQGSSSQSYDALDSVLSVLALSLGWQQVVGPNTRYPR